MGGRWPNSRQKHRGKTSRDALYIANSTNAKLTANSYFKLLFFCPFLFALLLRFTASAVGILHTGTIPAQNSHSLSLAPSPQPPASSLQRCRQLPSARARHRPPQILAILPASSSARRATCLCAGPPRIMHGGMICCPP